MIGIFHLDIFDGLVRNFCIWYAAPNLYIPSFWFSLQSGISLASFYRSKLQEIRKSLVLVR